MSQFIQGLKEIAPYYDAFIVDLWGVIHDGSQAYPGVVDCLKQLKGQGKKIVFLSNAPRSSEPVVKVLAGYGITADWYDHIVTSGETARMALMQADMLECMGKRYYYMGLPKDTHLLEETPYQRVMDIEQADFVLCSGYERDFQPTEELLPVLERALARKLELYCVNPDKEVVRINGDHILCAGVLGYEYERRGGKTIFVGKPYHAVYQRCYDLLPGIGKSRILAVGDNLETDIPGARDEGLDSALITGGILSAAHGIKKLDAAGQEKVKQLCGQEDLDPTFVLEAFHW